MGEKITEYERATVRHAQRFGALAGDLEHVGGKIQPQDLLGATRASAML